MHTSKTIVSNSPPHIKVLSEYIRVSHNIPCQILEYSAFVLTSGKNYITVLTLTCHSRFVWRRKMQVFQETLDELTQILMELEESAKWLSLDGLAVEQLQLEMDHKKVHLLS